MTKFKAGAIGIVALILLSYFIYTKFANPFASPYTVHAVFSSANGVRPESLVRIAGINVGKVSDVSPVSGCKVNGTTQKACQAANVTMTIDDNGLPIHKDATFAIRPRIFLEGNFFIDVHPGTPSAPTAPTGYTFPIQQGTVPVQLDQVLTSLQSDTRRNLQLLLEQYGTAVKQGGPAYNSSIQYWAPAYKYSSIVAHDFLGTQPHDLSKYIDKMGTFSAALDAHPPNLKSFITDFNTTAAAFARESVSLQQALAELPRTLAVATPAFNALNAAFPPARAFARALIPGVVSSGPTIDASLPFINQLRLLVQPAELQGLAHDLSGAIPSLARLTKQTIPFMRNGVRPLSSCVANVIIPWSHSFVPDKWNDNSTQGFPKRPAYVEGVDFLPGLAGESRVFDANGPYVRILLTGGTFTYSLSVPGQTPLIGQSTTKLQGVQPTLPSLHSTPDGATIPVYRPPLMRSTPCDTQPATTNLAAPVGGPAQQAATDLSAPGAALRWHSAAQAGLDQIRRIVKQNGISLKVVPPAGLK